MSGWTIYWFTRLDSINGALTVILVCIGAAMMVGTFIFFMVCGLNDIKWSQAWKDIRSKVRICAVIWILAAVLLFFLPTTREFAAIYLIPKIVNNEQVAKVPDKAMQILNGKLDEWLDGLSQRKIPLEVYRQCMGLPERMTTWGLGRC